MLLACRQSQSGEVGGGWGGGGGGGGGGWGGGFEGTRQHFKWMDGLVGGERECAVGVVAPSPPLLVSTTYD